MKLSLNWLKDYLAIELSPEEIAKVLTSAGLEVDDIQSTANGFDGVVVGEVLSVEKHPDADKLCVAQVSDGTETFQVVCAASNCRAGIKTAFAKIGASLTGDDGKAFKIKKSKLRGVESSGMLCAADELGLSDKQEPGIMEFTSIIPVGTDLKSHFSDTVFEISLTPNLGHCSSIFGVARELSAALSIPCSLPAVTVIEDQSLQTKDLLQVSLKDERKCPRYACRVIKDVKVAPSPEWLQQKLKACGIRPINNIVDITNFVFLEMGQPLHAFDYDLIDGKEIIVRSALANEQFITLDDKERVLTEQDLLICDKNKAVAIAGVMGGKNSEVSDSTVNVLLEAAYFEAKTIRKTSKRLGLSTDSSKRFERGSDPNALLWALERASMLIQELGLGKVASGFIDKKTQDFPEKEIACRLSKTNQILGTSFSISELENLFKRLQFHYRYDGQDTITVKVPTFRVDITQEIDLIEEAARIYGYDYIERTTPLYKTSKITHTPIFLLERLVRERMIAEGLQEFLTCDLIGPSILEIIGEDKSGLESIKVLNPISVEQSILRTSLQPGLLSLVKYNKDHQNHNIYGFEIGRIHYKQQDQFVEQPVLGIVMTGLATEYNWYGPERYFDFFDMKAIIENLLQELRIFNVTFKNEEIESLHTGRQAAVFAGPLKIGSFGEIHPNINQRLDIKERIYFAEFNLHDLSQVRETEYTMKKIPQYPGSERDWTLTVNENVAVQDILDLIKAIPSELLKTVSLIDIYRSDKIGTDRKNVTLHFVYRDDQKTVSQEEVDSEHERITQQTINKIKP